MILKSFSKINLSLNVNKKINKNLHNIQSFFCILNLFDCVKIKRNSDQKDIIKFKGKFSDFINNSNNSISKTLKILRKKKLIHSYYIVTVNKKIPVFAGLGGGTSNGAFLVKKLVKGKIEKSLMNVLERKIGSDFKLFFYKQGYLKNLKQIDSFKTKYNLHFLLIYPNIRSSTKFVYSKVKKYSPKAIYSLNKINTNFKFVKFLHDKKNDLQSIVEKKHPIIKKLTYEIGQNRGCYFSRMTGSGSVCYGVFQNKKNAKIALRKMRKKYPNFWLSIAKTI